MNEFNAYILTGGKSKRFGTDKSKFKIDNISFLDRIYNVLEKSFQNVYIVGKQCDVSNKEFILDLSEKQSALVGIISALEHTSKDWCFIISVDMPFITNSAINSICNEIESPFSIIIPKINKNILPLCGLYKKDTLSTFKNAFDKSNFKIKNIIMETKYKIISLDSFEIELSNINYMAELELLLKNNENRINVS